MGTNTILSVIFNDIEQVQATAKRKPKGDYVLTIGNAITDRAKQSNT